MADGHSENKLRNETIQKEGCPVPSLPHFLRLLDTVFYSCFAITLVELLVNVSYFLKKLIWQQPDSLANSLHEFQPLFGMFDWSPVFYSGTDEWKYNLFRAPWTLPFARAAFNTKLKLYNIPVAQKPEENELLPLGLLEKQQECKLHVFLKKP